MNVALVILNKNDAEGAKVVLPKIDRTPFSEILVVDGNSTDESHKVFKDLQLNFDIVKSGGRGAAMRYAIDKIKSDYVVFFSTDGEEDPADLPKFIEHFNNGADLVIASRLAPGGLHKAQEKWYWIHRMLYLRFFTALVNFFFKSNLHDCWNGYRGFNLKSLREVKTDAKDYLIEAQQTIRFLKSGRKVVEFPTREGQRIAGVSGNPIFESGFKHLVLLYKELFYKS